MEEQIRVLETEIKQRVKKIKEVEKQNTLLENRSSTLEDTLKAGVEYLEAQAELRRQVYLYSPLISSFCTLSFIASH
jgi:hypothetical protein